MRILFLIALSCLSLVSGQRSTCAEPIRGVNMRLLPYQDYSSATPLTSLIDLNNRRLDVAADAGFNFVRVGITLMPWLEGAAETQEKILDSLQALIVHARTRKLSMGFVLMVPARQLICGGEGMQGYLHGLAGILKLIPDQPGFTIEPVSEPATCTIAGAQAQPWDAMQDQLYRTVRQTKTHIKFVVYGSGWGALDGLLRLKPGQFIADRGTLFTFHYYEPFLYTHQQVSWLRPDKINQYVEGLDWPETARNTADVRASSLARLAHAGGTGDRSSLAATLNQLFREYQNDGSTAFLRGRFAAAAQWAKDSGINTDRILLGEFGVHRQMLGPGRIGTPWPTAAAWLSAVRKQAETFHMGWAVWDLDSGFGVICGSHPGEGAMCPEYQESLF